MRAVVTAAVASLAIPAQMEAQQGQRCTIIDSVDVVGIERMSRHNVVAAAGIPIGDLVCARHLQEAIDLIYSSGQVSDIVMTQRSVAGRQLLVINITERPMLTRWSVSGTQEISERRVSGRVTLLEGRPYDPAAAARSRASIDSLYRQRGYYDTRVALHVTPQGEGSVAVSFDIQEGSRIALSQIVVDGNEEHDDGEVVGHMALGPEGFLWWKTGEYNEEELDSDIRGGLPEFYGSRGLIDFKVTGDTLLVDENTGKGKLILTVDEGERYEVASFSVAGNHHFPTPMLEALNPFGDRSTGFLGLGGSREGPAVFDRTEWEEATDELQQLYANEGYIYARITPFATRRTTPDGRNVVDLRWQIVEGAPAIVNKVIIRGNTVTHEDVIRRAIVVIPGDVFRQNALIQSYQNVSNLNFFEQPLAPPTTQQANQQGDIDIIFTVQERHTGNINFGATVGQGVGVGGFIGLDEPNLFGRGKRARFQWQFGRNINDISIGYTDPALRGTLMSASISLHNSRLRYTVADLGRITSRGGTIQFGFPVLGSRYTRLLTSYTLEQSDYDSPTLSSRFVCDNCTLSSIGLQLVRDVRIGLPFPTGGTLYRIGLAQNGGPLGGSGNFQRATFEGRWYVPLGQLGGTTGLGSSAVQFVLGLSGQVGFVWGDVGPHFRQLWSMGGTQYGIPLRGYEEFSITPQGYDPSASGLRANTVDAFGSSYHVITTEIGARISQAVYLALFMDAGNVWAHPREYNPTRVFRGAGISASLLSPLGPIGIDYAYGFDRVDEFGNRDPKWKFHFRLGNIF
ncbi:MAG: outer membrane protein assembly factor BamA [Gemmatimonadota bacterium]|nr:MAG: outer membrane protein assembly factor BamA [Gemmatimonadota bacterium]